MSKLHNNFTVLSLTSKRLREKYRTSCDAMAFWQKDMLHVLRAALGDLVRWPDPTYNEHEELEARAEELRQAFSVGKPLSEMILEDRGEI